MFMAHTTSELTLAVWSLAVFCSFAGGCTDRPDPPARTGNASTAEKSFSGRSIKVFVGSASKPATEEAAALFQEKTGAEVVLHFGGSGQMLSQLRLTERGDVYFPGSSDYMELAKREGDVIPDTETRIVYLIPAINVPPGNPKGIASLEDLGKPGVRVGIARPDAVCVGLYAVEVLEKNGMTDKVRSNIVTQVESCAKTAQLVSMEMVDAVIGWRVFEYWAPEKIKTILLPAEQIARIGYIPAAVASKARDPELAEAFIEFLTSPRGQAVFRKWHYLTSEEEARKFTLADTPLGGECPLPETWQ